MARFFRLLRRFLLIVFVLGLLGLAAGAALVYTVNARLPDVQVLRHVELQEPMYVYARDGRLIGMFGEKRRYPVEMSQVPQRVRQAFLAAEDAHFYQHHGIDVKGITRAIWLLIQTGGQERVAGGSTITQQVAKQFFLSSEYSFKRKFEEMLLAMKMERELSKDEIFALYLNKSFFGNRAYGIGAAAEYYYGKPLDQLSIDEAATLAGIPKFPTSGNPITNTERARQRRDNYILPRMFELGYITRAELDTARAAPMHAAPHERPIEVYAPYVAEMVRKEMIERYGEDVLNQGYHVTTTIDPALQADAQAAVVAGLREYDHRHGWRTPTETVTIPAGADNAAIGRLLHATPVQGGLLPAVVTGSAGGALAVVLADGSALALSGKAIAWTHKPASALAKPGDVVRVRRLPAATPEAAPAWELDQLPTAQSALVSLDANTGALRALIGGFSFAGNKFNRATQAKRQPGSSFKPFLYAVAFERGFNPASIVLDAPVVFRERGGRVWRPQNDGGSFSGPMRLREALVRSKNLVSVRLLDAIGVDYARKAIAHFGFDEASLPPNLSMSLGTASLTPLSVARGYTAFANGGFLTTPWFIESVRDRDGKEVFKAQPPTACPGCTGIGFSAAGTGGTPTAAAPTQVDGFDLSPATAGAPAAKPTGRAGAAKPAKTSPEAAPSAPPTGLVVAPLAIDPRVAFQVRSMMHDVIQRGTATAARVLNRDDIGGKTGSTNNYRDAWFSGYGGPYVTTVWVGRDDFKTLGRGEYGGRAALPIWINYMRAALKNQPQRVVEPPAGMVQVSVSAGGRLIPGAGGITEWVKVEDLQQMENEAAAGYDSDDSATPSEESFDIF
ncbi:PBP1A family penicillin-binding protein [Thermomonas sp.]|uniref:penicillin-binding protein 1A n=1 Tax=Thermomonas sp. TaxID=1971895 RepID=UPI002609FC7E|nr:PBP1A family penicillin-binding protein [Thermomonas sp.]MCO5055210.1 PBP1A family penicillin-binding protein [Thermomonas sp.]